MQNLIINFTPTGMLPTKSETPYVPITAKEIVEEVKMVLDIGITMVHLHAREERTGNPISSSKVYREIISGIRSFSQDLVICVSLSGRYLKEFKDRAAPLSIDGDLKPDMGSLTLSSLNFNNQVSENSPKMIQELAVEMNRRGIMPELEAFDSGMINYAKYLEKKKLLSPPHYFNLILGNIACAQADLLHAGIMIRDLPENSYWSLGGVGRAQFMMNMLAIVSGGGVRIGIEDNIWLDEERTELATNATLLNRIHNIAKFCGRKIMSPAELRVILKLQRGNGKYGRI